MSKMCEAGCFVTYGSDIDRPILEGSINVNINSLTTSTRSITISATLSELKTLALDELMISSLVFLAFTFM